MSYAVNDAVKQVKTRLGEAANTTVGDLPSGTGSAASPTITTDAQIVTFLTEGCRQLVMVGAVTRYGGGTVTPAASARSVDFSALTMYTTGQRLWKVLSASYNSNPIQVASREYYEVHNPLIAGQANATPERVYPEEGGVLLAPRPAGGQVLRLEGIVLPRDQAAGSDFVDIADQWVPPVIAYAASKIAAKFGGQNDRVAGMVDVWWAEWLAAIGRDAPQ
jgi:hypothetical protein